jgi:UDP-N-acetylmuramoyl-tripeptide--D-alanyl-D-alanine ligase
MITSKHFFRSLITNILLFCAKRVIAREQPVIIVVTGSAGKTSTKDAIFHVLTQKLSVRKSIKSYNSELGIPLTILGYETGWSDPLAWLKILFGSIRHALFGSPDNSYPRHIILEADTRTPGDLSALATWLKADYLVITSFGDHPAHLERFASYDDLKKEQLSLVGCVRKEGTILVSECAQVLLPDIRKRTQCPIKTFGFSDHATLSLSHFEHDVMSETYGIRVRATLQGMSLPLVIPHALGHGYAYALGGACLLAHILELNVIELLPFLESYVPTPGRMHVLAGIKRTAVIDDTYNASPDSMILAVHTLRDLKTSARRIVVLGGMKEVGTDSKSIHTEIGRSLAPWADSVIGVGEEARAYIEGALLGGLHESRLHHFDDAYEAGIFLQQVLKPRDTVLIKGAQAYRMERVVKEVMSDPASASVMLVRQESEWENR